MGDVTYYPWVPKLEADWHLIAAAPDLLACLIDAVAAFADCVEGGEANQWVIASRAAIAKALGS